MTPHRNPTEDFKELKLPNGLKAYLRADRSLPLASLQVWVRCGSIDEPSHQMGIAHFLEHMVFKGNPKTKDISRIVESRGGSINASTQQDLTHYYVDLPREGLEAVVDALGAVLSSPELEDKEVENERRVVLEEMTRHDDSPNACLWDKFMETCLKGTPYSRRIIGTRGTVGSIGPDDLGRFHERHYTASRMVVTAAGDFEEGWMLKRLAAAFQGIPLGKPSNGIARRGARSESSHKPAVVRRDVQQAYIAAGFPTPGLHSPHVVTLELLADILGGGASSRLYKELREDKELVWSLASHFTGFARSGMLSIFAELKPANVKATLEEIREGIGRLSREPPSLQELHRAKSRLKSQWLWDMETLHGQAAVMGHLSALGRADIARTYLADLEKTEPRDIQRTCRELLCEKSMAVAVIRPRKS